jgi:hypothetical protein
MRNTGGGKGFICSPTFHCYCPPWSARAKKKLARKKDARKCRQQQAELRPYRGQEQEKKKKERKPCMPTI